MTRRDTSPASEHGVAMISAMLVIMVATGLVATVFYTSLHSTTATGRNNCFGSAIHIAESGVHDAIANLQNTSGAVPAIQPVAGTTAEGRYEYRVALGSRRRYTIDSVGICGNGNSVSSSRRLRVTMAPPSSFSYALFSLSDVTTKNQNVVCGDIWANADVVVYQNDEVVPGTDARCSDSGGGGSATAATGSIQLQNGSYVAGDAWSGGSNSSGDGVSLGHQAEIGGLVKATSSTPGCSDDPTHAKYGVDNGGSIGGDVTSWGSLTGGGSTAGTVSTFVCPEAPTPKTMPTFTWNEGNYLPDNAQVFASPAAFQTFLATNGDGLSGAFKVLGVGSEPIRLDGVKIGGDTTIYAPSANIDVDGLDAEDGNTDDKVLVLVSEYAPPPNTECPGNGGNPDDYCAIGGKNDLDPGDNTAVLLYAPNGPVAVKNNAEFRGAVYANNIQVKNNMNVVYDPRVDQIIGFGPVTLDVTNWLECTPGPVTSSGC